MGFFSKLFGRDDYTAGSKAVSDEFLATMIIQALPGANVMIKDCHHLLLTDVQWSRFLAAKSWALNKHYRPEVLDCDDFAALARADIIKGAYEEGFRLAPAFFEITYKKKSGGNHGANILAHASGRLQLYEPQNGELANLGDVAEAFEVWG